jgi:hypothetical protein
MYRIEVKSGEEVVFRTIEELATGIRNGFVTPRARIYHAASQKWLPIEFHPHYKKALAGDFTPTPPAPQASLAAMPTPTFAFPSAAPAPVPSSPAASPAAPPASAAPVITAPSPERAPSPPPPKAVPSATAAESPVLAMRAAVRHPHPDIDDPDAEGPVERYSPVPVAEPWRRARVAEPQRPVAVVDTPDAEEIVEASEPVAVLEAPRLAPAPEVVLPNITYPDVPPMEPELRATARRSRRTAGRPLLLIGSAAVLVLGGQRYLASRGGPVAEPAPVAEASTSAPVKSAPRPIEQKAPQPKRGSASPSPVTRPAQVAPQQSAPAAAASTQRMQPGPAFAASVPARGAETPAAPPPRPSTTPAPPAAEQAPRVDAAIAPAPTAIDLDLPAALPGESIAPAVDQSRDSLALKRILKAVTGRKANPTTP